MQHGESVLVSALVSAMSGYDALEMAYLVAMKANYQHTNDAQHKWRLQSYQHQNGEQEVGCKNSLLSSHRIRRVRSLDLQQQWGRSCLQRQQCMSDVD